MVGNLRWKAHLLAEVVQMEQRLQICALPLSCHVEVGQLRLEGPLGEGKGCQLRELGPSCLPSPGGRCQLGRLLAQLQASAVLGLSGEGRVSTQLQPLYQDARLPEPVSSSIKWEPGVHFAHWDSAKCHLLLEKFPDPRVWVRSFSSVSPRCSFSDYFSVAPPTYPPKKKKTGLKVP